MPVTDRLRSSLASRYSIEREIGAGGMATVYLARDVKHDREVALKVLRSDLSAVIGTERFLSEVRIAAQLDHPHILTLIDSGEADGILYYVMPYVRGESLRSKLTRERQLPVEEALSITRQVASALDYAHGKGVVHRDIKPENILLHEGEAVLADFGIALAVREASGSRMTETGLSLGTPQYMSPEQATGDRAIDKRSDIYSLAAVFYEMIAGEPPVSGVSAQAVIAKLMTEKPTRLRVLRDSISAEMDNATAKALAKVPADRFTSAGEYARALAVTPTAARPVRFNSRVEIAIVAVVGLALAGLWMGLSKRGGSADPVAVLRDRTQITFTGRVSMPTITADGKTLAYVVSNCGSDGCRYGVEMQDIGGSSSRRILDGATAIYGIKLSGDRRNLLLFGTIKGAYGSFIVPTLGGVPRFLGGGSAALWAGGDSLVFTRSSDAADVYWLLISGLDGVPRESIRVDGPAKEIMNVVPVPGSGWFLVALFEDDDLLTRIVAVDRKGTKGGEISRLKSVFLSGGSADAAWATAGSEGTQATSLLRIPFDSKSATFGTTIDTVYTGVFSGYDVVDDGSRVVIGEESSEYTLWALPFSDALRGNFTEAARIFRTTGGLGLRMARDGSYVLISRDVSSEREGREWRVVPYGSRAETVLPGRHLDIQAIDSVTLHLLDKKPSGIELSAFDRRTGRRSAVLALADSNLTDWEGLPNEGWAWIPLGGRTINVRASAGGAVRTYRPPPWFRHAYQIASSRDGRTLAFSGWNAPAMDSVGIGLLSLDDGRFSQVATFSGEGGSALWLTDGRLLIVRIDTPESATFLTLAPGGKLETVGSVPRPLSNFSISRDMRRFVAISQDRTGDAWVSTVLKR